MRAVYGGGPTSPGYRSRSPRQERVAQRLLTQVGPGPAAFFRDSCRLVSEGSAWPSATHLVAHLLREVESAVRLVLEPAGADALGQADGHKAKIRAILTELGISQDDLVAEFWLGFAGQDNPDNLATRAHRSALEEPRPFNDEFVSYVDKVEQVLDAILERFEINYFEIFERLEDSLATPQPTDVHANMLRQKFPHTEAVAQHFFNRASAAWVGPLHRAGFFTTPPPEQIDEDAGTVLFPPWPASQFLARVAAQAPDAVVRAALTMAGTDNSRVNHDLVEIAVAIPAPDSARLVPRVIAALGGRFSVLIPQKVGALVGHLCRGGQIGPALDLAAALFKTLSAGYGPAASVHGHAYGVVLREHVPELVAAAGLPSLGLLCQTLDEVVHTDTWRIRGDSAEDGSPLWRLNIEGYERRSESNLRHSLVDAVRDAASSIVESGLGSVADVVTELESHHRVIFRRIALDLLSNRAAEASDFVAERMTDAAISADWRLDREYLLLARSGTACLDPAHLRRLLTLIDGGPAPATQSAEALADAEPQMPESAGTRARRPVAAEPASGGADNPAARVGRSLPGASCRVRRSARPGRPCARTVRCLVRRGPGHCGGASSDAHRCACGLPQNRAASGAKRSGD